MNNKQLPLHIDGINDSLYAGFWQRLASLLLDFIFIAPIVFLILYVNGLGKNIYFYTLLPHLAFGLWYNVYLPKRYGCTPGKLLAGIKIVRLDGQPIDWKEAILRHIVALALTIFGVIIMSVTLLKADEAAFSSLNWMEQYKYLVSLSPVIFKISSWTSNIWTYSELVVLLTNKRKRAIHDFIAGTVTVKARYEDTIRAAMNAPANQ